MNKPMNLKDLPTYIQSGANDEEVVVDMGMIVENPSWTRRIAKVIGQNMDFVFASAMCMVLAGFVFAFNSTKDVVIVVNSNGSASDVSTIIKENGGEVVEAEDNTYKVRINRLRSSSFLEKLKSNKLVDSIEIKK